MQHALSCILGTNWVQHQVYRTSEGCRSCDILSLLSCNMSHQFLLSLVLFAFASAACSKLNVTIYNNRAVIYVNVASGGDKSPSDACLPICLTLGAL